MYNKYDENIVVRRHWIILFAYSIKFFFLLFISFILWIIATMYGSVLGKEFTLYILIPLIVVLIHYAFFRFIFYLIEYYNYLFIIAQDQIFIINTSFILQNDIEVIDAYKIIKLDAYSRGFFSNILSYGKILIEIQTNEQKWFVFMPHPFKLLSFLQIQREFVLENRKNKYILDSGK